MMLYIKPLGILVFIVVAVIGGLSMLPVGDDSMLVAGLRQFGIIDEPTPEPPPLLDTPIDASTLNGQPGLHYLQAENLSGVISVKSFSAYADLVDEGRLVDGGEIITRTDLEAVVALFTEQNASELPQQVITQKIAPGVKAGLGLSSVSGNDETTLNVVVGEGIVIQNGQLTAVLGERVDLLKEVSGVLAISNGGTGLKNAPGDGNFLIGSGSGYGVGSWANGDGTTISRSGNTFSINLDGTVCRTSGNCSGAGGGIVGAGQAGQIAYFSASDTLTSISNIAWNTSTDTFTVNGTVNASNFTVNGQPLSTSNVAEGAGLYWTQSRFNAAFSAKSTDDLSEGSGALYWSNARFDSRLATKTTSDIVEGSRLYYTDTRVSGNSDVSANTASRHTAATISDTTTLDLAIVGQQISGSVIQSGLQTSLMNNDAGFITNLTSFTTTNLTEGSNLYFTLARFDTALSSKSTSDLAEGTNLYWTQLRFDDAFGAKSTTNLTEGANLYWTQARFNTAFDAKDTDDLTEGVVNLYYTEDRFDTSFGSKDTDDLTEGAKKFYSDALFGSSLALRDSDDISEGVTNLYYSSARFDTDFAAKSTDDLTEGTTALYWSNTRFDSRLATKSTTDIAEGTRLYYTDARVSNNANVSANTAARHAAATVADSTTLDLSIVGQQISGSVIQSGIQTSLLNNDAGFITNLSGFTTTNLAEGSNLYYTQARFNTAFDAKSTDDLSEGSANLYSQWANTATGITFGGDIAIGGTTASNSAFYFATATASLALGTSEALDGALVFHSSGTGITSPSISTNSAGDLVLSAPSGKVTVGDSAGGDINLYLATESDSINFDKTTTLTSALTSNDYIFTRNLTGGANNISGAIVMIQDTSTTTATNNPDMLLINATPSSGTFTGNLLRLQSNGSDLFVVNSAGEVGVGTSDPSQKVEVVDGDIMLKSTDVGKRGLRVTNSATGYTDDDGLFLGIGMAGSGLFEMRSNLSMTFRTNLTARLVINGDGSLRFNSYTTNGGMLFTDTSGNLAQLGVGTAGQCLVSTAGVPTWGSCGDPMPADNVTGTGVAGQIAFFDGANTQVGDANLSWDNTNKRLGIGTATPSDALTVNGGNILHKASSNPTLAGSYNTSGSPRDVYVSGHYAFVADWDSGMHIFDVTNPAIPTLTSTYNTVGTADEVHVAGSYAYVADNDGGLQIIDISDPASPSIAGSYVDADMLAQGVYVSGGYAYIADALGEQLQIINVTNTANPTFVGSINLGSRARSVQVVGSYAYVASDTGGLNIIDISDPASPSIVGTYNILGFSTGVHVSGHYAYVAAGSYGLQVIDISDPTNPISVGAYDTSDAHQVYTSGIYAYVADRSGGFQVIDLSNPASPTHAGEYTAITSAFGVFVAGGYAYVTDLIEGLQILNINSLRTPAIRTGSISVDNQTVLENINIGNNAYIRNGLNIGAGGIMADGGLAVGGVVTLSSFNANGGLLYTDASGLVAQLGVGTAGQCLVSTAGVPAWGSCGEALPADNVTGSGAANQIAFWNGTNTQSGTSKLTWNEADYKLTIMHESPYTSAGAIQLGSGYSIGARLAYNKVLFGDRFQDYIEFNSLGLLSHSVYPGQCVSRLDFQVDPDWGDSNLSFCDNAVQFLYRSTAASRAEIVSNAGIQLTATNDVTIAGTSNLNLVGGGLSALGNITSGSASTQGGLVLYDGTGFAATLQVSAMSADTLYVIPGGDGGAVELCTVQAGNCGLPAGANPGDMLYWTGSAWANVPAGTNGQAMIFCNGKPVWGADIPQLTTVAATNITFESADTGGNITNSGCGDITERGVVFSTTPNPTVDDGKTLAGSGDGSFNTTAVGLPADSTVYLRAYAINAGGVGYGNEISFITVATPAYFVGDTGPAGGIVYYDKGSYSDGWRYLEAATTDQSTSIEWGCRSKSVSGATGTAIGTGLANTVAILNFHNNPANFGGNDYYTYVGDYGAIGCNSSNDGSLAAKVASEYSQNGYGDWFLPSQDELNELYMQKDVVGGFASSSYWSSTQTNNDSAKHQIFDFGYQGDYVKSTNNYLRIIRSF